MFIECPECYERKFLFKLPPSGKKYRCSKCGTVFIFLPTDCASKREFGRVAGWSKATPRVILVAVISLLLIIMGGSSFVIAKSDHALATPFRGAATTVLETSSGAIGLIKDVRGVVAAYERNIVSIALQSMRATEDLSEVPPVTVPTNDMARFPSTDYPLFPKYVEKRFSQFKYTVDNNGIVSISPSGATTDSLLERINQLLEQ